MATPFRLKRSAVSGKRPSLQDLQLGELALNTNDGYLFAERDTGGVGIGTTVALLTPWIENFGGSSIYYQQSVGIGSINPTAKLDVNGNVKISGVVTASSFVGSGQNLTGLTGASADTYGNSFTIPVITVDPTGRITSIGTSGVNFSAATVSQTEKVRTISTDTSSVHFLTFVDSNNAAGDYENVYTNSQIVYNPGTNLLGIGTVNPKYTLEVVGNSRISGILSTTNLKIYGSVSAGNTTGQSGQYLKSTGNGIIWANLSDDLPPPVNLRNTYNYSATANQKVFSASGIHTGYVDVFINGIRIDDSNYSIVGTGISLNTGAIVNDEITIVGYSTFTSSVGSGGGGATNLNGLTDVTISSPTNGQVLKYNGSEWINDTSAGGGSPLTVSERPGIGGIDDVEINNVTAIRFDSSTGFNVTDLGSGEVFVDLGSTFNPWYVDGQGTLKADGEEPIEFIAGPGIAITTKSVASVGIGTTFSKAITISAIGGGGSGVADSITLGSPTDGFLSDGLLALSSLTTVTDAIDKMNETLNKLAPEKPQNLSAITSLILSTSNYSAIESSTGITRSNVVNSTTPSSNTTAGFYDGDSGTLSAWIDGSQTSSRVLSTANDSGTYGSLIIVSDTDPYVGQSGKAGFWKELTARVQSDSALAVGIHTYQLKHSGTGDSGSLSFYVDNPVTTSISSQSFSLTGAATTYVSGVPTLSSGTTFTVTFTVNNAIKQFYNSTKIADVSGGSILSSTVQHSLSGVQTDQSITTTKTCTVGSGKYSESNSLTIIPYNSAGNSGTTASVSLGARVDTVSNESSRKIAGSGQYPTSGYGSSFDSTQNLRTSYTEELQLINGRYQWPSAVNYASNVPTAGPDYSTGMGSSDRWYLYQHGTTLTNISAFTLSINGASGFSGTETPDVKIYAKVEGVTGWIDCNSAYPGSGNPLSNGDPAMVFGSSTATSKRITFGTTARSGTLYIRIGLPAASSKYFTSLSVTLG